MKRSRAVFPKEGNDGKRAISQWFDPALTASGSDSQCSEVKAEKLFFHRSQSNCKEKSFPAGLKQVGRCSCHGCRSPAITSSRAAPPGSQSEGKDLKHWVCFSGKEIQLLDCHCKCCSHGIITPFHSLFSPQGHLQDTPQTEVLFSRVQINSFQYAYSFFYPFLFEIHLKCFHMLLSQHRR